MQSRLKTKQGRLILGALLGLALLITLPLSSITIADAQKNSTDVADEMIDDQVSKRIGKEKAKMVSFLTKKMGKLTASPESSSADVNSLSSSGAPFSSSVMWESPEDFLVYDGAIRAIPSEATMAVNPLHRDKIVAGFNDDSTGVFNTRIVRSNNLGTTWIDEGTWGASGEFTFNQIVLADTLGRFYYVAAALDSSTDIRFRLSLNNGDTWSAPVIVATSTMGFNDKPWAAIDDSTTSPFRDNLYVCWTDFESSTMGVDKIQVRRASPSLGPVVTVDSVAGARIGNFIQGCYLAVDDDGKVYIAWMEMTSRETGTIRLRSSTDGAATFGPTITVGNFDRFTICDSANGCLDGDDSDILEDDIRVDSFPRLATDSHGGVHVVYSEKNAGSGGDVMYSHASSCTDVDCSFSDPIAIPSLNAADQWHPSISVLELGDGFTLHVLARDRSETGNASWKIMNYHCDDPGGEGICDSADNWSTDPISLFSHTNLGSFYTGDYDLITSPFPSSRVLAIWTDTADGNYNVKFDRTTLDVGGEIHYNLDLFEGGKPSDLVANLGQELSAVAETDDANRNEVTIRWIDPAGDIAKSTVLPLVQGSASDDFAPDQQGTWRIEADFGGGLLAQATVEVSFFVLPESPVGAVALVASTLTSLAGFLYLKNRRNGIL